MGKSPTVIRILEVVAVVYLIVGIVLVYRDIHHRSVVSAACLKVAAKWLPKLSPNQVLYVDGCFVPSPLVIKAGQSVTFTNSNMPKMWIESDKVGNRLWLPSFNSGQSWIQGESYGYQFKKRGFYGYHNRLTPSDQGRIVAK